jgi:hypothetical protein
MRRLHPRPAEFTADQPLGLESKDDPRQIVQQKSLIE